MAAANPSVLWDLAYVSFQPFVCSCAIAIASSNVQSCKTSTIWFCMNSPGWGMEKILCINSFCNFIDRLVFTVIYLIMILWSMYPLNLIVLPLHQIMFQVSSLFFSNIFFEITNSFFFNFRSYLKHNLVGFIEFSALVFGKIWPLTIGNNFDSLQWSFSQIIFYRKLQKRSFSQIVSQQLKHSKSKGSNKEIHKRDNTSQ